MKTNNSNGRRKKLDQIDFKMIKLLQKDGRISNTEIAKKVSISEATVRSRLNRLIEEKFIQIELKKIKALWFIVQSTGGTGIESEFVVKSLNELNDLIFEKINKIEGIVKTETALYLKFIKRQYDWGTAMD